VLSVAEEGMIETEYKYQDIDDKGRDITATITAYRQSVDPAVEFKEGNISLFACSLYPADKPQLLALLDAIRSELESV
jgi:hypothetical protein